MPPGEQHGVGEGLRSLTAFLVLFYLSSQVGQLLPLIAVLTLESGQQNYCCRCPIDIIAYCT